MLIFSLPAWLKLQLLCHAGETEIGAFAITRPDNPLYVEDVIAPKQYCTSVSVEFDDGAISSFFDEQVDAGRKPVNFFRLWLHTHPGDSPNPSGTDEDTFTRVFGNCDWAVMFILAKGGATYCRLKVNSNQDSACRFSLDTQIPVRVDYGNLLHDEMTLPVEQWLLEHHTNVHRASELGMFDSGSTSSCLDEQFFLDELSSLIDGECAEVLEEQMKEVLDESR